MVPRARIPYGPKPLYVKGEGYPIACPRPGISLKVLRYGRGCRRGVGRARERVGRARERVGRAREGCREESGIWVSVPNHLLLQPSPGGGGSQYTEVNTSIAFPRGFPSHQQPTDLMILALGKTMKIVDILQEAMHAMQIVSLILAT
jgi:hypothetical protein